MDTFYSAGPHKHLMMMNILHDMEQHTGDPPFNVQQIWQRLNEYFDIEELV
jgi:hypothetical protein